MSRPPRLEERILRRLLALARFRHGEWSRGRHIAATYIDGGSVVFPLEKARTVIREELDRELSAGKPIKP